MYILSIFKLFIVTNAFIELVNSAQKSAKMHIKDIFNKQCMLTTFGILLSVSGVVFAMFWSDIFNYMMAKEMAMRPQSRSYDVWKSPPLPMSIDIYFFNWTNPSDFKNTSTKPILKELGPYRFTEKTDKVDINWHPENVSISFRKKSTFFFDENGSNGRLDDVITNLNIVALSAAEKARYWKLLKQKTVSTGLNLYDQKIHISKKARELLFEGYQDDMIDMARDFPIFGEDVTVPFDRFGWFYTRNETADIFGHFNMYTGEDNIENLGKMNTWNYNNRTDFFKSHCGMVNGSAGEFYPPKQTVNTSISFFTPDLCRSISFDFAEKVKVEGIEGFKYSGGPKTVDNGTKYPENECFCNGECVPSGVLNVSACRFGTPVFMSFPHYFNADPYYLDQVEGLNSSKDKHEFYMILEPQTGIALEVAARFQINMLVKPSKHISLYQNVPYTFMPVLWFEQKVSITKEMASELQTVLSIPTIGQVCAGVIIAIGLIMIFWLPADHICRKQWRNYKGDKKPPKTDIEICTEKGPEVSPLLEKKEKTNNIVIVRNKDEEKPNMYPNLELKESNQKILDEKPS